MWQFEICCIVENYRTHWKWRSYEIQSHIFFLKKAPQHWLFVKRSIQKKLIIYQLSTVNGWCLVDINYLKIVPPVIVHDCIICYVFSQIPLLTLILSSLNLIVKPILYIVNVNATFFINGYQLNERSKWRHENMNMQLYVHLLDFVSVVKYNSYTTVSVLWFPSVK